jgi:predicted TIM-barrel fold metal-dependent hydrolase
MTINSIANVMKLIGNNWTMANFHRRKQQAYKVSVYQGNDSWRDILSSGNENENKFSQKINRPFLETIKRVGVFIINHTGHSIVLLSTSSDLIDVDTVLRVFSMQEVKIRSTICQNISVNVEQ